MTILQPSTNATNAAATEGNVKSFLGNLRAFVAELLGTDSDNKQAAQAALQTPMHGSLPKSAGYTVTAADRGKIITASGALTLNVTAAATLGDGFVFGVWAKGGAVTIDPSSAEQIDGGVTKAIGVGKCALVYCDGSAFATVGVGFSMADLLAVDGSGSGLDADTLDGYHANNLPYIPQGSLPSFSSAFNIGDLTLAVWDPNYDGGSPYYLLGRSCSLGTSFTYRARMVFSGTPWGNVYASIGVSGGYVPGSWKCIGVAYTEQTSGLVTILLQRTS